MANSAEVEDRRKERLLISGLSCDLDVRVLQYARMQKAI
jgi:hypothetical protein